MIVDPADDPEETEGIYQHDEALSETPIHEESTELEETTIWYQEALSALMEEPEDGTVLANYQEARRALDHARVSRGFYPTRNPNHGGYRKGGGKGSFKGDQYNRGGPDYSNKICVRCGKKGHIARLCPQKPNGSYGGRGAQSSSSDKIGFVGLAQSQDGTDSSPSTPEESGHIFGQMEAFLRGKAILDSGASDNIIGVEILQELLDDMEGLGFDAGSEVQLDYSYKKNFTYGNNQSAAALGRAFLNIGLFGRQFELDIHIVEGHTPMLLSAKFLTDVNALIDFRTGIAKFRNISSQQYRLERTPGGHLVIPVLAFCGNHQVFDHLCAEPDPVVQADTSSRHVRFAECPEVSEEGKPEHVEH